MKRSHFFIVLVVGVLVLSACARSIENADLSLVTPTEEVTGIPRTGVESDNPMIQIKDQSPMENQSNNERMESTPEEMILSGDGETAEPPEPVGETAIQNDSMRPNWFSVNLTNVDSGETFRVDDFNGKVVWVETMAMWCSTCLRQQKEVLRLHELLNGSEGLISLALDIDPNEIAKDLEMYIQNYGFDWMYAISPPEVSHDIADRYGNQFLNPPSAPMFIIDAEGKVHPLRFGVKDANELWDKLQPFLDEVMRPAS
jgi:thiol-disulfide isomerase/thioredoxin